MAGNKDKGVEVRAVHLLLRTTLALAGLFGPLRPRLNRRARSLA